MTERSPTYSEPCPTPDTHKCVWDDEVECRCCEACVFRCLEEGFKAMNPRRVETDSR
jgi:hypothetical protein